MGRSTFRGTIVACALVAGACGREFKVNDYPTPVSLYNAGVALYNKGDYANAITALEQTTILLGARDSLMPRANFYLAKSHEKKKERLLAAETYKRVVDDFPGDTLADDAMIAMADCYASLWRGPGRDEQYALEAIDTYNALQRVFPDSPFIKRAQAGEARLTDGVARGDYLRGQFYVRRHAYDSALIYFQDVVKAYPGTLAARDAMIEMVGVYKKLKYADDAADMCKALRSGFPKDAAATKACAGVRADTTK